MLIDQPNNDVAFVTRKEEKTNKKQSKKRLNIKYKHL